MYYLAKSLELSGLFIIGVGMINKFPKLMNPKWLIVGGIFFGFGWLIEKYISKSRI